MRLFAKFHKTGASFFLLVLSISTSAQSKAFDVSQMDASVKACDYFYEYENGTWIKNTQIPGDRARYNTFDIVTVRNQNVLREIVERATKNTKAERGSNERLITAFCRICLNSPKRSVAKSANRWCAKTDTAFGSS